MGNWLGTSSVCDGSNYANYKSEGKSITNITNTGSGSIIYGTPPQTEATTTSKQTQEISHCCNNQCNLLKTKLQARYSRFILPKTSWTEEGYEFSLDKDFAQPQLNESGKSIGIEEIFYSTNSRNPQRILIEGQPGFGKTTLATKLAFDWATNKEYIKFKLLFFIPLQDLLIQRTIKNAIMKIREDCDYEECVNIMQIMTTHKKETLFILDGLDELPLENRYETMKVLYNQMYSESTVLTLCRTGVFKLTRGEHVRLFGLASRSYEFSTKRISISGIQSIDSKKEFLKKFISEQDAKDIIKHLSSQLEMFNSPLYLMMLSLIMKTSKYNEHFSSKTNIYKKIFNFIVRHTCVKRGIIDSDSEFDLFNYNSPPDRIRGEMTRFGELCVRKILLSDLKFDPNDLTMKIYQFGLLINHREVTPLGSKIHYKACHLSILEFAAAFAIWFDIKSNECAFTGDTLKLVVSHFLASRGTSLIIPFLASLMGIELDLLLIKIESFSAWFCLNYDFTAQLIAECSITNISRSQNLKNFISPHIYLISHSFLFTSNLSPCRNLLKYGCDCGKIKQLTTSGKIPSELFSGNFTTRLAILVPLDHNGMLTMYSYESPNLQEIFSNPIPFSGTLNECFRFAASEYIEWCALEINPSHRNCSTKLLEAIMTERTSTHIKYCYLHIGMGTELAKQFVINLLRKNQVRHLALTGTCRGVNMSDLLNSAAQSDFLTSFSCAGIDVDLYDITNGGAKKYNFIELRCCTATCRQRLSLEDCFEYVRFLYPLNTGAITQVGPCQFGCSTIEINDLIEKCPAWSGFNSVNYLKVRIAAIEYRNSFVSAWKNLQILHLQFGKDSNYDEMKIADSIRNIPIVKLVVEKASDKYLKLFEHMNSLWARPSRKKSQLQTIEFLHFEMWSTKKEVLNLIAGLKRKYWDKVNLVSNFDLSDIKVYFSIVDVNHFSIMFNDTFLGGPFEFHDFYLRLNPTYRTLRGCLSISKK